MLKNRLAFAAMFAAAALTALTACAAFGGSASTADLTVEQIQNVSELASLKCYYHNVAKVNHKADDSLGGYLFKWGYKKQWIEFDGTIEVGFDLSHVSMDVGEEELSGTEGNEKRADVTIYLPSPEVLGDPNVDEDSFDESLREGSVNNEDKAEAVEKAKADMRERAAADSNLMHEATVHAETLLRNYVEQIGDAKGVTYNVKFEVGE